MKKIIALILVIGCVLSLASCNFISGGNNNTPDDSASIPEIQAKIDASAPKGADVTVTFKTSLGELNGTYHVVYNEDGTATVDYSYEKFNKVEDGVLTLLKSTYTGTVTVAADGTVIGDIGSTDALNAISYDLKLDESKLSSVSINAGVLRADVKAADTEAVLGAALDCDVNLIVATSANGVSSFTVGYTTNLGEVEIVTTYT